MSELVRRRIQRPYVVRYVLALLLVAACVVGGHVALERVLTAQESSAAEINVAGRQRMLSQRVAGAAALLVVAEGEQADRVRGRLVTATDRLEREHAALRHGDDALGLSEAPPPPVLALLDGPAGLDAALADFVDDARGLAEQDQVSADDARLARLTAASAGPLLEALDDRVAAYQAVADARVARTADVALALTAATLLLLASEAAFVFRPMGRRIAAEARRLAGAEEAARSLAEHDPLTGLPNRRHVQAAVARYEDAGTTLAVAIGDVDHFKQVNDTYGHLVGDDVLVAVARTLQELAAETGLCARLGGEEFLVVLPGVAQEDLAAVLRRSARVLAARCASGGLPPVTLTWGVTESGPGCWTQGLRRADRAVLEGKRSGRDRVVVADADTPADVAADAVADGDRRDRRDRGPRDRRPLAPRPSSTGGRAAPATRPTDDVDVPAQRDSAADPGRASWDGFARSVARRRPGA